MRKTFLAWLLIFMIGAFAVTFLVSFLVQTNQAADNAETLIQLKIDDVTKQLEINQRSLKEIRAESDQNALAKVRAFATMLDMDPALVYNREALERIQVILDVDELHISDDKGILIGGTMESYYGYDYASDPQSTAFLPAITDPGFELAQDPQPKGINQEVFQYVGVARRDAPGIVQIGYRPEKLSQAMEVADISNLAHGFRVGKSGSVMIANQDGIIVSIIESAFLGKRLTDYGLYSNGLAGREGSFTGNVGGSRQLFAYRNYGDYLIIGQLPFEEMYLNRNSAITLLVAFNVLLFAMVFVLIAKLVQTVVINGIYEVNQSLARITAGDLDEVVDVATNGEFVSLSQGINTTVNALKEAISEAASRIDSELAFAQAIQLSALPANSATFTENESFTIFGGMYAAREVGGDFYDYFMISEDKLGFVIADVSDKGIPAALFMMVAKSLIKHYALSGLSTSEICSKVNNSLCENNSANMFVTAFIGILELSTGRLTYANAGHNLPLIKSGDNDYTWLESKRCLVLAGMEDVPYVESETRLAPGDRVFLYTDGVTEAVNRDEKLYTEKRLQELLNQMPKTLSLEEILEMVKGDVDRFATGVEQADDITMVAVEYRSVTGTTLRAVEGR